MKKIDVKKPKSEIREGFESMQYYAQPDPKKDVYRYYFKGRVVNFVVAKQSPHEIDGVPGMLLEIITDSNKANIWYEAFQRASDGVVFFLGESDTQAVHPETRTLEWRKVDKFN